MFERREIDIVHPAAFKKERLEVGNFSQPIYSVNRMLITKKDSEAIKSLNDLDGKIIVLPRGWAYIDYLSKQFPKVKIIATDNFIQALDFVSNGKADATIEYEAVARYYIHKHSFGNLRILPSNSKFDRSAFQSAYYLIRKDWPQLLTLIDKAINNLSVKEITDLKDKYYMNPEVEISPINLTDEEKLFLRKHPTITLGTDSTWIPYVIKENDGQLSGLDVDFINLINKISGANFQLKAGNWNEMVMLAEKREIDGLSASSEHPERAESFNFSNQYIVEQFMAITSKQHSKKYNSIKDLEGKRIVIQQGNIQEYKLAKRIPNAIILYSNDLRETIDMLVSEQADITIGSINIFYNALNQGIPYLEMLFPLHQQPLVFSVRKDWPEAISIINKSLNAIPQSEKIKISQTWFLSNDLKEAKKYTAPLVELSKTEERFLLKNPTIKLGIDQSWAPHIIIKPDGSKSGFEQDFIKLINQKTGANFELVTGKLANLVNDAENKKIDGLASSMQHQERLEHFNFSLPYRYSSSVVISTSNKVSKYRSKQDLVEARFVIQRGNLRNEKLLKEFPESIIIYVDTFDDVLQFLIKNEADVTVGSSSSIQRSFQLGYSQIQPCFPIGEKHEVVYSIRNDWPEAVSILNKAIKAISPSTSNKLYNKWYSIENSEVTDFTHKELEFISQKPIINYCIDPNWYPYEFIQDGKHSGLTADYLDLIEKTSGLTFNLIPTKTWSETLENVRNGICNIVTAAQSTPKRLEYLDFTTPYLRLPVVIATSKNVDFVEDLAYHYHETFALIKDYAITDIIRTKYPNLKLIYVDNDYDGLMSVVKGDAFALISTLPTISAQIAKNNLSDIRIAGNLNISNDLSYGIAKDQTILYSIINKSLNSISDDQHLAIRKKWGDINTDVHISSWIPWLIFGLSSILVIGIITYANQKRNKFYIHECETKQETILELSENITKLNSEIEQLRATNSAIIKSEELVKKLVIQLTKNFEILSLNLDNPELTTQNIERIDKIQDSIKSIKDILTRIKTAKT
jgi:polar amino acid transport system substrate-binding protein